jgi:hypothetical protein
MPKQKKIEKKKIVKKPKTDKQKPRSAESKADTSASPTGKKAYSLLRGMHDILPKEEKYWKSLYHAAENLAEHFQFGRLETPLLEENSLFVRSIGRGTDVVDKEMYSFEDRDGNKVALRPENTAFSSSCIHYARHVEFYSASKKCGIGVRCLGMIVRRQVVLDSSIRLVLKQLATETRFKMRS